MHHVVALGLVVAVCTTGTEACPLWLAHNLSDPPLHVAKLLKYSAWSLASTLFGVFVLVFFTSRLLYYVPHRQRAARMPPRSAARACTWSTRSARGWRSRASA